MKFFLDILKIYSNVISAIIGALLTYILDKRLEKNKLKETIEIQLFNQRNKNIEEIYKLLTHLKKYYELFIYPGQEFEEQEIYTNFAPLDEATKFRNEFEKREMFLKEEMRRKIREFSSGLGMGCSLALYVNSKNIPEANEEAVFSYCQSTVNEIETLQKYLCEEIKRI